ncbi:MAG: serine/threonine-protein kinase [Acidobacteriota bacterium]
MPILDAGHTLADRFKVVRFLGSGGMGEVFQADDLILGDQVALKVFRSQGTASAEEMRRLRKEVQLARRVTHRNVCRIFDLIQHRDPRSGAMLDLISMELLAGETLQDLIQRRRRLRQNEALPIARQIARGLNAAHSLGIIHRDLKPANIMLVEEPGGTRAVITDFGLAHLLDTEEDDGARTTHARVVGTPAYMAPEQVTRETTSAATDVYTLGIVIYEMLTGRLPFSGESPWLLAINRVTGRPTPIRDLRPGLDPVLVETLETCLRRDPDDRYASVHEVLTALDRGDEGWNVYGTKSSDVLTSGVPVVTPEEEARAEARSSRRETHETREFGPSSPAENGPGKRGDAAMRESRAGLDSSARPLDAPETPGGRLSKPRPEGSWIREELDRRGSSSYRLWPFVLLVAAGLAIFWNGKAPDRGSEVAQEATAPLSDQPVTLAPIETSLLGYPGLEADAAGPRPEVAEARSRALRRAEALLERFEGARAEDVLMRAIDGHGSDPLLLTRLAEAHWRTGREAAARRAIREALEDSAQLPTHQRRAIEGFHAAFHGEWREARHLFKSLYLTEGDFSLGLWVLEARNMEGVKEAVPKLMESLEAQLEEGQRSLRFDFFRLRERWIKRDSEGALALARSIVEVARANDFAQVEVRGLLALHSVLRSLGEQDEGRRVLIALVKRAQDLGPKARADAMTRQGWHLNFLGHEHEARVEISKARTIYEQLGSDVGLCKASSPLSIMRSLTLEEQIEIFETSLESCRQAGMRSRIADHYQDLGRFWRDLGDFQRSAGYLREGADLLEELDSPHALALNRVSLAVLLSFMGRLDESRAYLESAAEQFRQTQSKPSLRLASLVSAEVALWAGDMSAAARHIESTEALEPAGAQMLELYLLRTLYAYEAWDLESLDASLHRIREYSRTLGVHEIEHIAAGIKASSFSSLGNFRRGVELLTPYGGASDFGGRLALDHLALGELDHARAISEEYSAWTRDKKQQGILWFAEIVDATIDSAEDSSSAEEAARRLEKVEREARDTGFLIVALEAALARARVSEDEALLREVRDEAASHGLDRIAHVAGELRKDLGSGRRILG